MKGSVKLPVFIDDARKYVNTTQLRAKYLGASYEAEYCQWQALHGLGSLMETASLIITPNAYLEGKLIASYPPDPIGDFDVTRATTATRVNSAGLVELVPYNLLSYSEDFSNSIWNKTALSISTNSTTAPNGSTTADTLTNSSSSGIILQTYSSVNTSQIVTHSVYLKRTNNDWAVIAIARSGATTYGEMYVWFNLSTGVVGGNLPDGAAVILDTEIENVGNGWYRCSVTGYVPNAVAYTAFMLYPDGNNSFTRVTGQSVYAWGAQLVEGSTAKDYQKTETRLNIPRLDYSNGTCPSLLVEPQRTNLLTWSQDLTQWNQTNEIASRQLVANPLTGVNNATKITKTSGGGDPYVGQIVGAGNGTYTYSAYLWTDSGQPLDLTLFMYNASVSEVYTLAVTLTTTPTRYELTSTFANTGGTITTRIDLTGASANQYIYAYGAQLEAGSYSTSYIPTTSASVTRNADVISKTGISSLIGQTEGTLFFDLENNLGLDSTILTIDDGTNNNRFLLYTDFATGYFSLFVASGGTGYAQASTIASNNGKFAIAYNGTGFVVYRNGVSIISTNFPIPLNMSAIRLNGRATNDVYALHAYKAVALWTTRLTNTQLAQLTSI